MHQRLTNGPPHEQKPLAVKPHFGNTKGVGCPDSLEILAMSLLHCACPNCHKPFNVPAEIQGKEGICPHCRCLLVVKEMSGKTILKLAGVDGHAPTILLRGEESGKGSVSASRRALIDFTRLTIWTFCCAGIGLNLIRFWGTKDLFGELHGPAARNGAGDMLFLDAIDSSIGAIGSSLLMYLLAKSLTTVLQFLPQWRGSGPRTV
jgi:hypothetical protein